MGKKQRNFFTKEDDSLIKKFVEEHGPQNWNDISDTLKTKTARQCRERWNNKLAPSISTKNFEEDEDLLLIRLVYERGTKWSEISKFFIGRTGVSLKNRYQLLIRHKRTGKSIFYNTTKKEYTEYEDDFFDKLALDEESNIFDL
jgi:hypothetical protein